MRQKKSMVKGYGPTPGLTEAASVKAYDTSSPSKEPSRDAQVANNERERLNRGTVGEVRQVTGPALESGKGDEAPRMRQREH